MNNLDRPAKNLRARRSVATISDGFPRGQTKDGGTLAALRRKQTGRSKPTVKASIAMHGRNAVTKRKWGPQVPAGTAEGGQERSVRLRLQVRRGRITVLDSAVVDAPAPDDATVRGTTFLEVRSGDSVIGLQSLVDPGLSVGIPDESDSADEFRGHRVVREPTWETAIRIPIDAVRESEPGDLTISIYSAPEHLVLETRSPRPLAARVRSVSELATSAPLRAKDLPSDVLGGTRRKRRTKPKG